MGGKGSGRRPAAVEAAMRAARKLRDADPRNLPVGDEGGLSRVILEPWRERCLEVAELDTADAIATELAGRTWQGTNPYAAWLPPA